jgi:hypothetical protein
VSERDRGDRPKKSWREIDQSRDGSRSREPRRDGGASHAQADRASKEHRRALDALFEKGGLSKVVEALQPPPQRSDPTMGPKADPASAAPQPAPAPPPPAVDDPRTVLRKKVLAALGRDEVSRAVDRYVKAHGMPEDFEILEQALEHHKNERIAEALGVLEAMLATDKPKRSRTLQGKLRFIEETSDDPELRTHAAHVRSLLG